MTTQLRPVDQLVENSQCDAGDVVTGWVVQSDEIRNILITDRDTAYTLLREGITKKRLIEAAFPGSTITLEWKQRHNAVLDDILTLLDHIYGKTDALTK